MGEGLYIGTLYGLRLIYEYILYGLRLTYCTLYGLRFIYWYIIQVKAFYRGDVKNRENFI